MIWSARKTPLLVLALSMLVLSACAQKQTRSDDVAPAPGSQGAPPPAAPAVAPTPPAAAPAPRAPVPPTPSEASRQFTGVSVCDEYLASYRGCHRVIGTTDPAVAEQRLESLRANWQSLARDPDQRETLVSQCQNLTDLMKDALNGRSCEPPETDFVQPED